MGLKQVKRLSVSDQVLKQLEQEILSGAWKPGDKIPSEKELASIFGVSLVSVRQSLQKLKALGLLDTRHGEGTFICEAGAGNAMYQIIPSIFFADNSLHEVLEFRKLIESPMAEMAVQKATQADIEKLENLLNLMKENNNNRELCASYDYEFHMIIAEITNNQLVISTYRILNSILSIAWQKIVQCTGVDNGIYFHSLILDAFKHKDAIKCKIVMLQHINDTYDSVIMHKKD